MAKALALIDDRKLANVRLHFGDATEVLDWLPPGSLSKVDLLFPDPWPKRRHWKRRFVQDASIACAGARAPPWRYIPLRERYRRLRAWTLERFLRSPAFVWTAERADDWRQPWQGYGGTRYEAKAKREGRSAVLFDFLENGLTRQKIYFSPTIAPGFSALVPRRQVAIFRTSIKDIS